MTEELKFFIFLIECYSCEKGLPAGDVLREWDRHGITDEIFGNYLQYHQERIENAYEDIDSLLAEEAYREALSTYRRLAEDNPAAFLPYVAETCHNMGILLKNTNRLPEAEEAFREALSIRRRLAEDNPDAFLHGIAETCACLGTLYADTNRLSEAEDAYNEALSTFLCLAEDNPDAFLPDVAMMFFHLGVFEDNQHNSTVAKAHFEDALSIYERFPHLSQEAEKTRAMLRALEKLS